MLLCKVFPVHITLWNGIIRVDTERSITNLNWQTIFKIEKAHLTDIFQLAASLANFTFLVSCIPTRSPPEDREGPSADLALLIIICFGLHIFRRRLMACIETE